MKLPADIKEILNLTWRTHSARNISFLMTYSHLGGYIDGYPKYIGVRFNYLVTEGKGADWMMYRNLKEDKEIKDKVYQLVKDSNSLRRIVMRVEKNLTNFKKVSNRINQINIQKISNAQLANLLSKYTLAFPKYTAGISTIILVAEATGEYLKSIIMKKTSPQEAEKVMSFISAPAKMTLPTREEIDFLKMIIEIKQRPAWLSQIERGRWSPVLEKHFKKYCWLTAYMDDTAWHKTEFLKRVADTLREKNIKKKIKEMEERAQETERTIKKQANEFKLDENYVNYFRQTIYHRILGETMYGYANIRTKNLFREIARRLYLSEKQVRYLSCPEINLALKAKLRKLEDLISQRERHYLVIVGKKELHSFEGLKADQIIKSLKIQQAQELGFKKDIKGNPAVEGLVRGVVKVINNAQEVGKIKNGEILVAPNTTPSFVPAMKRAAAIVTDEGGITCHAAIVSRELGIPCVIGTKIATKVLKDGDMVEVDATRGVVRKLTGF